MKKILYVLGSRLFWVFIGIIGLSLLIWFFGGIVAIGDVKPLASKVVRGIIIAVLLGLTIFRFAYKRIKESRRNKALVDEMKVSQEPMLKHVNKESNLSKQFDEIDSVLKNAQFSNKNATVFDKFFNGQYLYQMPWYVVLGPAGSGKTTAIRQSGLTFPLESSFGTSISGLAGTKDCDWFLTDDSVLLDTAGRLALQESEEGDKDDIYDWQEFVGLLKRYRPKQPINGVIVTVGADDLLNQQADANKLALQLKKRVNEMRSQFGIDFPVYLIVTKLDVLNGFEAFFEHTTEEERSKSLGFSISKELLLDDGFDLGFIARKLRNLEDSIDSSYLQLMQNVESEEQKSALFSFAEDFSILNQNLVRFFDGLYKSSKFEDRIPWKGVYFTSAVQGGEQLNPYFDQICGNLELSNKYETQGSSVISEKSFFLHSLLSDTIINDAGLAEKNAFWTRLSLFSRWFSIGLIAALSGLLLFLLANSYRNNVQYLSEVNKNVESTAKEIESNNTSNRLLSAIEMASSIRSIPTTVAVGDIESPPFVNTIGLYQGRSMQEVADVSYQRALRDSVMPLINTKLEELLQESINSTEIDSYNALKAYIMWYQKDHYDPDFLQGWLVRHLLNDDSLTEDEDQKNVKEVLNYLLTGETLSPSLPYNENLVEQARQSVSYNDISTLIINSAYQTLLTKVNSAEGEEAIPPVSFREMGGRGSQLVFSRKSKNSLADPIDAVFTKDVYVEYVLPQLLKTASTLHSEEDWVLGDYASNKSMTEAETFKSAKSAYYEQYVNAWNAYIADLTINQPKNLRETKDLLKLLSDSKDSPLKKIIEGISYNTSIDLSKQVDDETKADVENLTRRMMSKVGLDRVSSNSERIQKELIGSVSTSTVVDVAFRDYLELASTNNGKKAKIDEIIQSIDVLYEYTDKLEVSIDKGVDLPDIDPIISFRTDINRLPTPFRVVLDDLSDQVLQVYINERDYRIERKNAQEAEEQRIEEEKEVATQKQALLSNIEKKVAPISAVCNGMKGSYPFTRGKKDVSLANFARVFGNEGYMSLKGNLAEAKTVAIFKGNDQLLSRYNRIDTIDYFNRTFFVKSDGGLGFDIAIKVIKLDAQIDKMTINYGGKVHTYTHGPLVSLNTSWPVKSGSDFVISLYRGDKRVGSKKISGDWSVFKFVDGAKRVIPSGNRTLVVDSINNHPFSVELTTGSPSNPFNFGMLRKFRCP